MTRAAVAPGEAVPAVSDRRAGPGFLADRWWWVLGAVGLIADLALCVVAPTALAGSALHGAGPWASAVLLQPVLEELAFRGFLQGELRRTSWGRGRLGAVSGANLATSLAFTALHFLHHPPLWAASVFLPSLVFGWLRERHGGVAAPIGMHVLYNLEFFSIASLTIG